MMEKLFDNKTLQRVLICALLVLLAVVSMLWLGDSASSVDRHHNTISSIDSSVSQVMKLTAAATAASAVVSALPDDTATPIADKLSDFAGYFLIVLCVLYAEKYGITILGTVAFRFLIPAACVLVGISLFTKEDTKKVLRRIATKGAIFAIAIYAIIPASIKLSDMIYATYADSIDNTVTAAEQLADVSSDSFEDGEEFSASSVFASLAGKVTGLVKKAAEALNRFVETLAVIIVNSCIIPVLVAVFFVWLAKLLTGARRRDD